MEALKTARMNSTNIKEKTWLQYQRNIERLAKGFTGQDYKNNDFLIMGRRQVLEFINKKSSSDAMKRMFYSVILIMLAPDKNDKKSQKTTDYKFYQRKKSQQLQLFKWNEGKKEK